MMKFLRATGVCVCFALVFVGAGCATQTGNTTPADTATTTNTTTTTNSSATTAPLPSPSASPSPASQAQQASAAPLTLPVLDAFFADQSFAAELKSKLQLTDEQVEKLRSMAREETARLSETSAAEQEGGRTASARARANEQIKAIIGEEKTQQLAALVRERWSGGGEESAANNGPANASASPGGNATAPNDSNAGAASKSFNAVPTDTRIVVNAPAYRMDVFENGRLVKSYRVGIGYPEFPLPTGMRKAREIIFNPTWTPPDSPWVATMKNVKAGEKVEAGSKLNPLGPIKIPIGMPSLIHGGKSPAKIGGFASHGCVGLTNPQVQDFAKMLSQIGGTQLTDADIANYARNKTETKDVKLAHVVPVELRYETIVVEDGKLHIYRDVYDRDTNKEENLRAVLSQYGVTLDGLNEQERAQALQALKDMSHDAGGGQSATSVSTDKSNATKKGASGGHVTRSVKGRKEVVIEIAALKGKGYPAPVNVNNGGAASPKSATATTAPKAKRP
ncbi:MAG: L,D-transpeptidase ErfK/SrfK [Blastocatellia bacterium]|nr:L,D-transpeptidase ErfK/SrfK [Blastocatellia bacterium]